MNGLIFGALAVAAFFYVGMPLLIKFSQKAKARARFEPLEHSDIPAVLSDYVYSTANALRQDGFTSEAYLCLPDQVPNVKAYLIMLTNRAMGDKAMVTVLMQCPPGQTPQLGTRYVEFSTRFQSGKSVDTLNSSTLSSFKLLPGETKTYLPKVQDPHLLYRIHRHVIAKFAGIEPGDAPEVYPEGGALPYLTDVMEKGYEEQAALGLFYRERRASGDLFRPTWYGAFYMTWGLLFPFAQLRRMQLDRRADEVMRSYRQSEAADIGLPK